MSGAHTIKLIKLVKLVINFVCNLCLVHYNIILFVFQSSNLSAALINAWDAIT